MPPFLSINCPYIFFFFFFFFFFKQKTAYEMSGDWSSDVCSSDLGLDLAAVRAVPGLALLAVQGEGAGASPALQGVAQAQAGPGRDSRPVGDQGAGRGDGGQAPSPAWKSG